VGGEARRIEQMDKTYDFVRGKRHDLWLYCGVLWCCGCVVCGCVGFVMRSDIRRDTLLAFGEGINHTPRPLWLWHKTHTYTTHRESTTRQRRCGSICAGRGKLRAVDFKKRLASPLLLSPCLPSSSFPRTLFRHTPTPPPLSTLYTS